MNARDDLRAFFNAWRCNFAGGLSQARSHSALADLLASQACDAFHRNADILGESQPAYACERGCDVCCRLQVSASAPEIFHAAHFIRLTAEAFAQHGVSLKQRLRDIQPAIAGKDQRQRLASGASCPFVIGGACAIYAARTLACRGHIAFDAGACNKAAQGEDVEVPVSQVHRDVRAVVQAALLAALRDASLASGVYEFLGALDLAMREPDIETRWRQGEDVFAAFQLADAGSVELADGGRLDVIALTKRL